MKSIYFAVIALIFLYSCSKESSDSGSVVDTTIGLTVQNRQGVDLLNPLNPSAFLKSNIKIYYIKNGVKELVNLGPNVNIPTGVEIGDTPEPDGKYWMNLNLLWDTNEPFPITMVQWNDNLVDTFRTEVFKKDGLTKILDVWMNDSLIWRDQDYAKGARLAHIIK